jgi:polysaccharide deacetylase family protein (PEP-CTERM system associated)
VTIQNAMTCDLEEYFQVQNFEGIVARDDWATLPSRLEATTGRVLDLLAEAGVRATFFVLGWNAERHPEVVRRIADAGHEIASHGYAHRMIFEQSPEEFREDVRRAKALLEDLAGQGVWGYRAPTFSITERSRWALDVLGEEGYRYDSSIFPIRHDRYGIPGAPRFLHEVERGTGTFCRNGLVGAGPCACPSPATSKGAGTGTRPYAGCLPPFPLVEFPPTTVRVLGCNVPVAGGGYLRLFPVSLVRAALRRVNRAGHPVIVYFHPWELDPEQPRLPVRGLRRFRHYVNLGRMADKLRRLLRALSFTTARAVVEQWQASRQNPNPLSGGGGPRDG